MKNKEYYHQIEKNGENVFEIYLKYKKTLSPIESMKEMRKDFPAAAARIPSCGQRYKPNILKLNFKFI